MACTGSIPLLTCLRATKFRRTPGDERARLAIMPRRMLLESIALMPWIRTLLAASTLLACSASLRAAQSASPSPTPADFDARFAEAVSLHQAGDLLGAMVLYEELLKSAPHADLRSNLGA
jgi:hypothetical protein